jgi:hypothetical protein
VPAKRWTVTCTVALCVTDSDSLSVSDINLGADRRGTLRIHLKRPVAAAATTPVEAQGIRTPTRERAMNKQPDRRSNNDQDSDALVQKSHETALNLKQATLERVDTVRRNAQNVRDDTAENVRKLGAAIHKVGEHFRIEDQQYVAQRMTDASQHVHAIADYVGSAELGSLVRDTRMLARDNTAFFLGGAFLLGLGTGRFLKGTSMMTSAATNEGSRAAVRRRAKDQDASVKALEASTASKASAPARTSRDTRS